FAMGTPVIASNLGAMAELVENGRTGLHFQPADPIDLASKVERLVAEPLELKRMRLAARQAYELHYTAESNYRALLAIYDQAESVNADLKEKANCLQACRGAAVVYNLAADMGGMGFIENNKALCMLSVLINTHLLMAAKQIGVGRYFFASSACVYNAEKQRSADVVPLREGDAYPAMAEDGYGWEKLFSGRMRRHVPGEVGWRPAWCRFLSVDETRCTRVD